MQIGTWAKQAKTPPERRRVEVVQGDPAKQLIRWSEEVDLIVVGTHGRKGMSRFMLGSVAARVVGARSVRSSWFARRLDESGCAPGVP